jgi:hypothetical protein
MGGWGPAVPPPFAGLADEGASDPALIVYGLPVDLWPDDGHGPPPLVPWPAADAASPDRPSTALVDRFDARLLLDAVPPGLDDGVDADGRSALRRGGGSRRAAVPTPPPADEELAADRDLAAEVEAVAFADLEAAAARQAASPPPPPPPQGGAEIPPPPGLAATGEDGEAPATAPAPFARPPGLPPDITHPPTAREAAIIARTAAFVRAAGGRVATEVALRAAQAGNPTFGFLEPGDPLHAFFRWGVESGGGGDGDGDEGGGEDEEGVDADAGAPSASPPGEAVGCGLPGLLAYGSGGSSSSSSSDGGGGDCEEEGGDGGGAASPGRELAPPSSSSPPPQKRAKQV